MPLVIVVPAVCAVGVAAVLPVAVPGAATSPGNRICSLVTAPGLTVMGGLVLEVLAPSVMLVAVTVQLPTVFKVTEKVLVPEASAALAGRVSFGSVGVMPMVLAGAALTRFQWAPTALPGPVPGDAVSPGTNSCSFTNAPALTVTLALVLAVSVAAASVAVMVRVPAVLNVNLESVRVPATKVMLPAVAPLSSALIAFVS